VLGRAAAAVLGGAVDLAQTADADGLAEVDVAGDGGGANVEPVNVVRGQLLGGTSLDGVDPTCRGESSVSKRTLWKNTRIGRGVNIPGMGSLP
jgi:hypothetical protein